MPYDEGLAPADAEANALPVGMLVPGVPGSLNVGHPQASEALATAAASRGATVVRGIGDVEVEAGPSPTVRYELDGDVHEARCRLVVGADGRHSTVRRNLGIVLQQQESKAQLGGLLVEGAHEWPADRAAIGTEGDRHFLAFPRPNGYVRLYLAVDAARDMGGADKASAILDGFRLACVPGSERLADAIPAGPAAFYRGTDTWSDQLAVDGAVLVGDAAGWSDPVIGQGLAVAMRDVRMVADVLGAGDDWSPSAFEPYATERAERMRRLRVSAFVDTELRCTFTPQGQARRQAFRELICDGAAHPGRDPRHPGRTGDCATRSVHRRERRPHPGPGELIGGLRRSARELHQPACHVQGPRDLCWTHVVSVVAWCPSTTHRPTGPTISDTGSTSSSTSTGRRCTTASTV